MISNVDPDGLIRKTIRYEFADGFRDIQMGLFFALMGVIGWLGLQPAWLKLVFNLTDQVGKWALPVVLLMLFVVPIAAIFGIQQLMNAVRRRWLWSESGIVKPARILVSKRTNLMAVLVFMCVLAIGLILYPRQGNDAWYVLRVIFAATGWASGVVMLMHGKNIELPRYIWLGVIGGVISTMQMFVRFDYGQTWLLFGCSWGALLVGSGLIALYSAWSKAKRGVHVG